MSEKGGKGLKSSFKSKDGLKDGDSTKLKKEEENETKLPSQAKALYSLLTSKNGEFMMDCEAFEILDGIKGYLVGLFEDPSIKIPVSYDNALNYVESCAHYSNRQSVRQVLEPLKTHGISDGEIFVIANTGPESIDEVFAFIPTLKAKKEVINQPLQDAVEELFKLKRSG